jgi:hypothetical protein
MLPPASAVSSVKSAQHSTTSRLTGAGRSRRIKFRHEGELDRTEMQIDDFPVLFAGVLPQVTEAEE